MMATNSIELKLNAERVLELLDSQEQFLTELLDAVQDQIAEERRKHLSVVAREDDDE